MALRCVAAATILSTTVAVRLTDDMEVGEVKGGPALCDNEVVTQACEMLNAETHTFWGTFADEDPTIVHAAEIAEFTQTKLESVRAYLASIGVANVETNETALGEGAYAVRCTDLCQQVVDKMPEQSRPPSSDVSCFRANGQQVCIDNPPNKYSDLHFSDFRTDSEEKAHNEDDEALEGSENPLASKTSHEQLQELKSTAYPDRQPYQVMLNIARAFRIFPLANVGASDSGEGSSLVEEDEEENYMGNSSLAEKAPPITCRTYCKDRESCSYYPSMCTGCPKCVSGGSNKPKPNKPKPVSPVRKPTATTDPWKVNVLRVANEAIAYVAQAQRNMQMQRVPSVMRKWYGTNDDNARREVKRILASVSDMLDNVEYKKQGSQCEDNTYAYVYPYGSHTKNSKGQFIFYLCKLYHRSELSVQIETLTHEGSHHASAYTDDVCVKGERRRDGECGKSGVAYGRETCEDVAINDPDKALRNADNFCYFVNDAYNAHN